MEQYVAGLDDTLTKLALGQDSETIRVATSTLNTQFYNTSQCVPALVEIIIKSPHFQVRQLACVELRKRISKWWLEQDEATSTAIRAKLLEIVLHEQESLVLHAAARVVSAVARIDIPEGKWQELLQFLYQCCNSPNAAHREVGIYCLYTLFETVSEVFLEHLSNLFELFAKTLNDPESKHVRITTVQALGKVAEFIEPDNKEDVRMFREMVPGMVNVLEQCLAESDEENAGKGFEVFDTLLMLDTPLLSNHLAQLVEFFLNVGANREIDDSLRVMALSFLMWAAVYKQNKLRSLKLVGPMIERIMPIGSEEDPEDIDEDSPSRLAFKVLNSLATNIAPQQVFPIVLQNVINYMQNPDANYRKAAMMAFAVVIEGCADFMRPNFNDLLAIVCHGLKDPEIIVRRAACMALGCLAEELDQEVAENHSTLLPLVFNLMNDSNPEITKHSCNALDAILEGLGDDVVQYLPMLMEKLLQLLDNAPQTETKATVTAAIGSAAHAAGESFQPYFPQVMPRLRHLMTLKASNDEQLLRGVATDSAGAVAEAVGAQMFTPYIQDVMQLAIEGMQLDSSRLRECSYCFYSIIARVFKEGFAVYLPTIMPSIIASCQAEEKDDFNLEGEIDLTTSDFDDDDDGFNPFSFNSAIADEKEIAADALGEIFENTRSEFLPYVVPTMNELVQLSAHISEGVRKAVTNSFFTFLQTFYVMSAPAQWVPGLPLQYTVLENVDSMIKLVVPATLKMWDEEDDKMVVVQICQEFVETIKMVGPAVIADHVDPICQHLLEIFEKRALCQQEDEVEDGLVDEDEQAEYESMLVGSASDLVGALAQAIGEGFSNYFNGFLPHISKFYKKTKTGAERSMAIGCLGEVIGGIKGGVTPHTEQLLTLFLKAAADSEEEVRSNAAYALGVLSAYTQYDVSSQYNTILGALYPLFHGQTLPNVTDNAAGAVARLILRNPEAVPLDQVLPTFTTALPLKRDFEENEPVFECIFTLFRANNSFVMEHIPQFLHIFAQVLSEEGQVKDPTKASIIELIRALDAQSPNLNIRSSELAQYL
ncbi:unnamed protein product [Umbelopsis ramanniana]